MKWFKHDTPVYRCYLSKKIYHGEPGQIDEATEQEFSILSKAVNSPFPPYIGLQIQEPIPQEYNNDSNKLRQINNAEVFFSSGLIDAVTWNTQSESFSCETNPYFLTSANSLGEVLSYYIHQKWSLVLASDTEEKAIEAWKKKQP